VHVVHERPGFHKRVAPGKAASSCIIKGSGFELGERRIEGFTNGPKCKERTKLKQERGGKRKKKGKRKEVITTEKEGKERGKKKEEGKKRAKKEK